MEPFRERSRGASSRPKGSLALLVALAVLVMGCGKEKPQPQTSDEEVSGTQQALLTAPQLNKGSWALVDGAGGFNYDGCKFTLGTQASTTSYRGTFSCNHNLASQPAFIWNAQADYYSSAVYPTPNLIIHSYLPQSNFVAYTFWDAATDSITHGDIHINSVHHNSSTYDAFTARHDSQFGDTTPYDVTMNGGGGNPSIPLQNLCGTNGMCQPDANLLLASLVLKDTPIGYAPAKGPPVYIRLTYNQQATDTYADANYFNVGPNWTINALSFIQDNPSTAGLGVLRYVAGGGVQDYGGYSSGTFAPELKTQAVLTRTTSGAISYTLTFPDGAQQIFGQSNGAGSAPRRVFLTSVVDPQGNALTYTYETTYYRLTKITDAEGRETLFCYDPTRANCSGYAGSSRLVSQVTDPFGRTALIDYNAAGRISDITDQYGIKSSIGYSSTTPISFVNSLVTPYGTSSFSSGENATTGERWLELTDPEGYTERVEYLPGSATGISATESTTPSGVTIVNGSYDKLNSFHWDKHAYSLYGGTDYTKARITRWLLGDDDHPVPFAESTKAPLERRVYYNYPGQPSGDKVGTHSSPSAVARVLDSGSTQITTTTYNANGKPLLVTDPAGRQTQYCYDSGCTSSSNVDLLKVRQLTAPSTFTDIAQYGYNGSHQVTSYTNAAGDTWNYTYHASGNGATKLATVTDPDTYVTSYAYDSTDRLLTVTNDNTQTVLSYTYPTSGNCDSTDLVNCELPLERTDTAGISLDYTYDAFDRVTSITYPDSTTELFNYTEASGGSNGPEAMELYQYTNRLGLDTFYAHDGNRRLEEVQDPEGNLTGYEYYDNGALYKLKQNRSGSPYSSETTWAIDVQSRPTSKTFDDSTAIAYAYETHSGRLSTVTDAQSQVKTYGYNTDDSLASIGYTAENVSTPDVTFSYDTYFPRRRFMYTAASGGTLTTEWQYVAPGTNGALSVDTENGPYNNDTVDYGYDDLGRVDNLVVGGTTAETFAYDNIGRLSSHVTGLGTFGYSYLNETGLPTSRSLSGSSITRNWGYLSATYDRRLDTITSTNSKARNFDLSYDPTGAVTDDPYAIAEIAETVPSPHPFSAATRAYSYDDNNRLLGAGLSGSSPTYTFAFDGSGNSTTFTSATASKTFTFNDVNALTFSGPTAVTVDSIGNMTADDGNRTYTFDAENRVKVISYTGTSATTTFTYDGLGRRLSMAYYNGSTTATFYYIWGDSALLGKKSSGHTVIGRYYGEGQWNPSNSDKWLIERDQVGAARDIIDATNGNTLLGSYDFTPYGEVAQASGSAVKPDFMWAGLFYDHNSKKYITPTRQYDPRIGRWIQRDFMNEEGGINLFEYGNGNPISNIDPLGTVAFPVIPVIAAAGGELLALYRALSAAQLALKMEQELEKLRQRQPGPQGEQYALRVTEGGCYEDVRGQSVHLEAGDVWKYGESIYGEQRYSAAYYRSMNLEYKTEFVGTQTEAKVEEKLKLYNYYFEHGQLPPGNKIFR